MSDNDGVLFLLIAKSIQDDSDIAPLLQVQHSKGFPYFVILKFQYKNGAAEVQLFVH